MIATPFHKILIANRGEIALRVMRSARSLGYRTVAVYSSADAHAAHVGQADQAVCIGGPLPAQSYLHIDAIVEAARRSGADAVHPGYGFLAENEAFARACRDAGLVFVGPSPEAIAAMGDKAGAKRRMIAAGVPCIPGYEGDDQGEERLREEAARIGYPVMIKATAGGGGRGMRLVRSAREFGELLHSAKSEAKSAFGDATVILERALPEPRHIEIQVFCDRYGNAIHLGERDCSVQRRHQKVIEEAPSPAVSAQLRERMGATAVAAAKAIGYEGAGTLEFLLDRAGNFYFMEMNTRLQVEHPVTEAITGLDLVELQLRVAAGEPLPLVQGDVHLAGHAIEVRLCAEDADKGFVPCSGTMASWQVPAGLRVEHAMHPGCEVPPYYDSMIAKIVAHGSTRDEARRKLLSGLEDLVALGVTTNQAFLARCLAHPVFATGAATTAFIAQQADALLTREPDALLRSAAVAALLLRQTADEDGQQPGCRTLAHGLAEPLRLALDGERHDATVTRRSSTVLAVSVKGREFAFERVELTGGRVRFVCDGLGEAASFHRDGTRLLLHHAGVPCVVDDMTHAAKVRVGEAGGDGKLRASMNGRVVALLAAAGDQVAAGQPVLTLEAMKMEHVHTAPVAGRLSAVHVTVGEQLAAGLLVAEIEPTLAEAQR
jgi:geranyl-CoA carboxylase alpha subunit